MDQASSRCPALGKESCLLGELGGCAQTGDGCHSPPAQGCQGELLKGGASKQNPEEGVEWGT